MFRSTQTWRQHFEPQSHSYAVWGVKVEKPSGCATGFQVYSTIQGKITFQPFLSLLLWGSTIAVITPQAPGPNMWPESGPLVQLQVLQNSASLMFMLESKPCQRPYAGGIFTGHMAKAQGRICLYRICPLLPLPKLPYLYSRTEGFSRSKHILIFQHQLVWVLVQVEEEIMHLGHIILFESLSLSLSLSLSRWVCVITAEDFFFVCV